MVALFVPAPGLIQLLMPNPTGLLVPKPLNLRGADMLTLSCKQLLLCFLLAFGIARVTLTLCRQTSAVAFLVPALGLVQLHKLKLRELVGAS